MMKKLILGILISSTVLFGCDKDEGGNGNVYLQAARDLASLENRSTKLFPIAYYTSGQLSWPDSSRYSCASLQVISGDTTTWPGSGDSLTIQLNYGAGCTDDDLTQKEGTLEIKYVGHPDSAQSTISLSFINFTVDGYRLEGSALLTSTGQWGQYTIDSHVGDYFLGSDTISFDLTGNVNLVDTSTSMNDWTSHVWEAAYFGTGNDINERGFDVSNYLKVQFSPSCLWISKGVTDLRPEEHSWRSLDYGTGLCDEHTTLRVGSSVYTFSIQ